MLTLAAAFLVMTPASTATEATPAESVAEPAPAPTSDPAPVAPEIANMRFCAAAMLVGQSMSAGRSNPSNAAMLDVLVGVLRAELTRLGDTDEAALKAEQDALAEHATAAGSLEALEEERVRFERDCLPFIMSQRG